MRKFNSRRLSAALVAALFVVASGAPFSGIADAAITFSFSNLEMTNVVAGDPLLAISGSITIPQMRSTPLSNLASYWLVPESIDITVWENGQVFRSFQNASKFIYSDGIGVDGNYFLNVDTEPSEDAFFDCIGLTFMRENGEVGGDFSTSTFDRGFYNVEWVPYVVTPEPSTWAMMVAGFAAIGLVGYRARRAARARAAGSAAL
jgi:hypothetical protein